MHFSIVVGCLKARADTDNVMDTKMANDSIETESRETIEQILRFHENDDSIQVKMIVVMAGSKEGDNYMSVVKRLIVSGTHDQNQNQNGNYFICRKLKLINSPNFEMANICKSETKTTCKRSDRTAPFINRSRAKAIKMPTKTRIGPIGIVDVMTPTVAF